MLQGTWYVVPTPFNPDGSIDLDSQQRLVDAAVSWEIDGLTVMGVTGEVDSLTHQERSSLLKAIFEANSDRVPIAVGCSGASEARVRNNIDSALELGASAAMVSAPPMLRDVDALPGFYQSVAAQGVPLIVQDEPNATGVRIPVSILVQCVEISSALALKLEEPPTPIKIGRVLEQVPKLAVFGGLGGVSALGEFRRGSVGTMTGFAYPEILTAVRRAWMNGDRARAAEVFDRYLPLIQFEGQVGIGLSIRKEVLRRRGAMSHARTRVGRRPIGTDTLDELTEILERVGIRPSIERLVVA